MSSNINIYQIYYLQSQLEKLDKSFIPYDNTLNENPDWREYHIFESEYDKKTLFLKSDLVGFFSWKFNQKSKLTGLEFVGFIQKNPGKDLYLVNPYPHSALKARNIWQQGEHFHPGMIEITKFIFNRIGLNDYDFDKVQKYDDFFCCNYWVANQIFWDQYILIGKKIKKVIEEELPPHLKKRIHERASSTINSNYIPFIYERLITTILTSELNQFKVAKYSYGVKKMLNRYGKRSLTKLLYTYFIIHFRKMLRMG